MEDKKFITLNGLQHYDNNVKEYICNELEPLEPLQQSRTLCELLFNPVDLAQYAVSNKDSYKKIPDKYYNVLKNRTPNGLFLYNSNPVVGGTNEGIKVFDLKNYNVIHYNIINRRLIDHLLGLVLYTDNVDSDLGAVDLHYCYPTDANTPEDFYDIKPNLNYTTTSVTILGWTCFGLPDYEPESACVYINGASQITYKQCFANGSFIDDVYTCTYKEPFYFDVNNSLSGEGFIVDFFIVMDFWNGVNISDRNHFTTITRVDNNIKYVYLNNFNGVDTPYDVSYVLMLIDAFNYDMTGADPIIDIRNDGVRNTLKYSDILNNEEYDFNDSYIINKIKTFDYQIVKKIPVYFKENLAEEIDIQIHL